MKVYDSANPPVQATASGASVVLSAVPQGTSMFDKAVTASAHMAISNPALQFSGRNWYKNLSTVALAGVVALDSLTIGNKTYVAGTDFAVGGNDTATAVNLAVAVNLGVLEAQPMWSVNFLDLIVDSKVTGVGAVSASFDVETSSNGVDWVTNSTQAPSGSTSAVAAQAMTKVRPFLRVKPTALTGTNARLQVWVVPAPAY